MRMDAPLQVKDVVCLSSEFLRSIGDHSYESANSRGVVTSINDDDPKYVIVYVQWGAKSFGESEPKPSLKTNLTRYDRRHLEPA